MWSLWLGLFALLFFTREIMLIHAPTLADWRVYVNQCPRYHRIPVTQSDTRFVDFIGDIHGAIGRFRSLMHDLGYRECGGRWTHPEGRGVVFLGDYIDRGPDSFAVYRTVRKMVEDGIAVALMGNHELNAIAFSTRANDGTLDAHQAHTAGCEAIRTGRPSNGWQRKHEFTASRNGRHSLINIQHHRATLVSTSANEYAEMVDWFIRLPLWLELPDFRAVHAAWVSSAVEVLRTWSREHRRRNPGLDATMSSDKGVGPATFTAALEECQRRSQIKPELRHTQAMLLLLDTDQIQPSSRYAKAVEVLLKGPELALSKPLPDPEGTERKQFRVRWFDAFVGQSVREYWMGPAHHLEFEPSDPRRAIVEQVPSEHQVDKLPADVRAGYRFDERAVFFGHYGLRAKENPRLGNNWACLDYSAFHPNGALAAYRFDRALHSAAANEPTANALLCGTNMMSSSWLEREHAEHGRPVDTEPHLRSDRRIPSYAEFTITLLNCESDVLQAEGATRALVLANIDRDTAAALGIPRVWPDQTPAFLDAAFLDIAVIEAIQARPSLRQPTEETADFATQLTTTRAIELRKQYGLPVPMA